MTTFDVVCTTIGDGSFLKHYAEAIATEEIADRARLVVIPDRKTPPELYAAVAAARADGFNVFCMSLDEQEDFLCRIGAPAGMFPWDSDSRRNIGYLIAWRDGTDVMVSVDDDNLPGPDFFAEHGVVAAPPAVHEIAGVSTFWNPCDLLDTEPLPVWPRGYPYSQRHHTPYHGSFATCEVGINAGLWLGDPDVDAITRLAIRPEATSLNGSRVLAGGTWAPVNSQNTAIRRDLIPAYFFFGQARRLADIYQGYLVQAVASHMGWRTRFGTPASDCGVRNDHDLLDDLRLEYDGIMLLDGWLDWLTGLELAGSTVAETYAHLAAETQAHLLAGTPMAAEMTAWLALCKAVS